MKTNSKKRIVRTWALMVLGLIVALEPAVGLSQEAQEIQQSQGPWAAYEVILNRNMFSRQRGARQRQREEGPRREAVVPNPESYFRLKGVVQEDGTFIAFLEDTRSNSVLKLRQGDAVARGIIKALTLDVIEYQFEDRVTAVRLGYDLEGGQGAVTMNELMEWSQTPSTPSTPSTAPQSTPSEAPTGDAADMLKQLMQRRQQELGK
jgi:hypothetical protein